MNNTLLAQAHKALNKTLAGNILLSNGLYLFFNKRDNHYVTFDARYHQEDIYQYICTVEEFINYKGDNMKTVRDAVNYFKAEWPDLYTRKELNDFNVYGIYIDNTSNCMYPDDVGNGKEVCNREQFNTEVGSMSTNYCRCSQTYAEYKDSYINSTEEETKVDYTSDELWKNDKYNPYLCVIIENKTGFKIWKRSLPSSDGVFFWFDNNTVHYSLSGHTLVKKPQPQPIFTKAMSDANELPKVGMECLIMYSSSNYKGTITYMGKGVGAYSKDNDKEYTFEINCVKFNAIDTRTDKEKADDKARSELVDGCAYQFDSESVGGCGIYSDEDKLFYGAGNEAVRAKDCSNIQKLTVEVGNG